MKAIKIFIISILLINCASGDIYEERIENTINIKYTKTSRGSNFIAKLNREEVVLMQNGFEIKHITKKTNAKQWKKITSLVDEIKLEELYSIKPLSNTRAVDASAHAVLEIEKEGEIYKTQVFDDAYPPEEIALLMKAIVTLTETVE